MSPKQNPLETFLEDNPQQRGRAVSYLEKETERQGKKMPRHQWIEQVAAMPVEPEENGEGFEVVGETISKTEYDYLIHVRGALDLRPTEAEKLTPSMVKGLPCLCGCGDATLTEKAKFIPGHDAKLKSILLEVEREIRPEEDIPEVARPFLPFLRETLLRGHDLEPKRRAKTEDADDS